MRQRRREYCVAYPAGGLLADTVDRSTCRQENAWIRKSRTLVFSCFGHLRFGAASFFVQQFETAEVARLIIDRVSIFFESILNVRIVIAKVVVFVEIVFRRSCWSCRSCWNEVRIQRN